MKPGSLLSCKDGEGMMRAIRWGRGGLDWMQGLDFDHEGNQMLALEALVALKT